MGSSAFDTAMDMRDPDALIALYLEAAETCVPDAEAFYLTQAYVTALEANAPSKALLARLRALGAEPE